MGKVFSWNEVECRMIPHQSDFSSTVEQVRKRLEAADGIIGAILCGSILYGDHNQRSDIDCVVVYDPTQRREVTHALRSVRKDAAHLYVPIEFIPIDASIAPTSLHSIGLSFATHLQYAIHMGGVIKKNPLPLFMFDHVSIEEDARGYLRNKFRRFEKSAVEMPTMTESDLHRFLQKILEAPAHIARKILWLKKIPMADDSRREVIKHYSDIASPQEYRLFLYFIQADNRYTAELLTQLHEPDQRRYGLHLEEIKNLVWVAIEFIKLNALRLA